MKCDRTYPAASRSRRFMADLRVLYRACERVFWTQKWDQKGWTIGLTPVPEDKMGRAHPIIHFRNNLKFARSHRLQKIVATIDLRTLVTRSV